jgi:hypothetical protein
MMSLLGTVHLADIAPVEGQRSKVLGRGAEAMNAMDLQAAAKVAGNRKQPERME